MIFECRAVKNGAVPVRYGDFRVPCGKLPRGAGNWRWRGGPGPVCAARRPESAGPTLFINAEPGAILTGEPREFCRRWPNQVEVTVAGSHFIQEDSPEEIAHALSTWIQTI